MTATVGLDWVPAHLTELGLLIAFVVYVVRMEAAIRSDRRTEEDRHAESMQWRVNHGGALRDGFDNVNARLDLVNGKLYDHERRLSRVEAVTGHDRLVQ